MSAEEFMTSLKEAFPGSQVTLGTNGRFWVPITPEELMSAVSTLKDRFQITQLAVIVPEDVRDSFLVNYVFTGGPVVVLQVRVDREKAEVPSLAAWLPGSMVYEREMLDLFGIMPVGHPDLRRQAVPEDWPVGVYPLRKDVQFNREGEVIKKMEAQ
jgi:Ni,Fe-hydrogenase III component G